MIEKIYVVQFSIEGSADYGHYTKDKFAGFLTKQDATYTSKCFNEICKIYKKNKEAFLLMKDKQYADWRISLQTKTCNIEQYTARIQVEKEAASKFWNNVRASFQQHLKDISHLYPCQEDLEPWFDVVDLCLHEHA